MKHLILFFVLCLFGMGRGFAYDYTTIDTTRINIYYRYECFYDTIKPIKKKDVAVLQIGKKYTAFFSPYTVEGYITKNKVSYKGKIITQMPAADVIKYQLYKDIEKNTIEHTDNVAYDHWVFTEKQPTFKWTMSTDTMSIMGYHCQKAECDYGGRHWTAWFSPEIPLNYGPYKFNGLPGLIMKIEDTSRHYSFEFASIDEDPSPIIKIKFTETVPVKKQKLFKELHKFMINSTKYTDLVRGIDNSHLYRRDYGVDPLERDAEFIKE